MITLRLLCGALLICPTLTAGCYWTLEQRWKAFDEQRQQEIGVKTKDSYLAEWGKPTKRITTRDGGEVWTWEFSGYGGAQGWRKTLMFSGDGTLRDFSRDYWPEEVW